MGRRSKPLSFELIEEGRLAADLDAEISRACAALLAHKKNWGADKAEGAKARISLTIDFVFVGGASRDDYAITGGIKTTLPGRPTARTRAIEEEEQDGTRQLFVLASGSTEDDPRQARFTTKDGRRIDPQTGEVLDQEGRP